MADIVNKETRSRMMSGIPAARTRGPSSCCAVPFTPRGFRYRLHPKTVTGRPDMVPAQTQGSPFSLHGCFWHRHEGCRFASTPATRPEFWAAKTSRPISGAIRRS